MMVLVKMPTRVRGEGFRFIRKSKDMKLMEGGTAILTNLKY